MQSMGHSAWLQVRVHTKSGHCRPPCSAGVMTVRLAVCVPLLHETEQSPQRHRETTQFTGLKAQLRCPAWPLVNLPAGHDMHAEPASAGWNLSAGQWTQFTLPSYAWNRPVGQSTQCPACASLAPN